MEAELDRKRKSEENQGMENQDRSRGLENCEDLVCSVLTFGMDNIDNFKVKELQVLL